MSPQRPRAADGWLRLVRRPLMDDSVLSHDRWFAVSACGGSAAWMVASARSSRGATRTQASPRRRRRAVPECSWRTSTGVALASRGKREARGRRRSRVGVGRREGSLHPERVEGPGKLRDRPAGMWTPPRPVDVGRRRRRRPLSKIRAAKSLRSKLSRAAGTSPPRHHSRRSPLRAAKASAAASREPNTAPPQDTNGDPHPQGRPRSRHGHGGAGTASTPGPDPALESALPDLLPRRHRAGRGRRLQRPGRRRLQRRRRGGALLLVCLPDARARLQDGPLGLLQQVPAAGHDGRLRRHGDRGDGDAPRLRRLRVAVSRCRAPPRPPRPSPAAQGTR